MMNLLITGAWKHTDEQLAKIASLGYQVIEMPDERGKLPCDPAMVDAVICNGLFLYHPIEQFASLKYIQLTSAGLDRVPIDYIRSHQIEVYNAAGVYSIPMAEFALSSVLLFYKQSAFFESNQRKHEWKKHHGLRELFGKTVCVIGCGNVGIECARRFKAFGCTVVGVNRSRINADCFDRVLPIEQLQTAVKDADIVILSIALTADTKHLINQEVLATLKDGCVLVNVARGAIVDQRALIESLEQKRFSAALDVFEEEPLSADSPLWDLDNVILTPHNSFVGDGNAERMWNLIVKNLEQLKCESL